MFVTPGAGERLRGERRARFFEDVLAPVVAEAERLSIPVDDIVAAIRTRTLTTKGRS